LYAPNVFAQTCIPLGACLDMVLQFKCVFEICSFGIFSNYFTLP